MEMGIEYIVRLIESKRAALDVSKNKLLRGICSTDTFTKIANGQGRKLDKLEIEALMQRIGYNAKNCNYLLDMMEEEQYGKASKLCQYAIGRLPDENKFRYLPEIYEMKARAEAHLLAVEKCYSDKVLNALYKESKDYKIYEDLSYIAAEYPAEYYADVKFPMYFEYNVVFIGDIIRQRRKLLGFTQHELAYYANSDVKAGTDEICSEKTLSRLENGRMVTSWKITRRLLGRLKLPPERYFFNYVADDYNLIEELMDIEADFSSGKKDGLLERCEAVKKANPLHYYPYNQQRIAEIEYKIKYMSGMITDAEELSYG